MSAQTPPADLAEYFNARDRYAKRAMAGFFTSHILFFTGLMVMFVGDAAPTAWSLQVGGLLIATSILIIVSTVRGERIARTVRFFIIRQRLMRSL